MGVSLVSSHEHPVGVDGEVDGCEPLLVELDELHDLHLPLPHVQEVDGVVPAHGEQLALVHHPDQTLHFAKTNCKFKSSHLTFECMSINDN